MQSNAPSIGSVTITYTLFYLGTAIVLNIIVFLAAWAFGVENVETVAGGLGAATMLIAAGAAGQSYGNKAGGRPSKSFALLAVFLFLVVTVVLWIIAAYLIMLAMGEDVGAAFAELRAGPGDDAGLIAGILGGTFVIVWLILTFVFSSGAGQAVKQAAMRAK
jgi:hypothetical protein